MRSIQNFYRRHNKHTRALISLLFIEFLINECSFLTYCLFHSYTTDFTAKWQFLCQVPSTHDQNGSIKKRRCKKYNIIFLLVSHTSCEKFSLLLINNKQQLRVIRQDVFLYLLVYIIHTTQFKASRASFL